eukprot:gene16295-22195_t
MSIASSTTNIATNIPHIIVANAAASNANEEGSSSSSVFQWTEVLNLTFLKIVHAINPHRKKVSNLKIADAWSIGLARLKERNEFKDLQMSAKSLSQKFRIDQKNVLTALGISKEGANLSALPERPSEYISLMLTLSEDENKDVKKRKNAAEEATKSTKKLMQSINSGMLGAQGTINITPSLITTNTTAADSVVATTTSSTSSSSNNNEVSSFSAAGVLKNIGTTLQSLLQEDVAASAVNEEDKALERELKRAQIRAANEQAEASKNQSLFYLNQNMAMLREQQQALLVNNNKTTTNNNNNNNTVVVPVVAAIIDDGGSAATMGSSTSLI